MYVQAHKDIGKQKVMLALLNVHNIVNPQKVYTGGHDT
jgi:hypothetical protein